MNNSLKAFGIAVLLLASTPAFAGDGAAGGAKETQLTLGAIQRSIKQGMSSAEVIEAAGSPNLVSRGRNGKESWVWDRFATESSEQGISAGGGAIGSASGGGGGILGALGIHGSKRKATTSQRTLMLVVTFGADGMVESFSYRSSKF